MSQYIEYIVYTTNWFTLEVTSYFTHFVKSMQIFKTISELGKNYILSVIM